MVLEGDRLVAVARCVRTGPDVADVAVVVGDPWQGQGLGRRLLKLLAERAAEEGITRFAGTMLADNRAGAAADARVSARRWSATSSRTACAKWSRVWPPDRRAALKLARRATPDAGG